MAVLFIGASVVATAADGSCASDVQGNSFFSSIPEIRYEGPESRNPFAFRFYNKDEVIMGKPMKEWWVHFWFPFPEKPRQAERNACLGMQSDLNHIAIRVVHGRGRGSCSHASENFRQGEVVRNPFRVPHRFRFSVAFWHSFCGDGSDPFGSGTKASPLAASHAGGRLLTCRLHASPTSPRRRGPGTTPSWTRWHDTPPALQGALPPAFVGGVPSRPSLSLRQVSA